MVGVFLDIFHSPTPKPEGVLNQWLHKVSKSLESELQISVTMLS